MHVHVVDLGHSSAAVLNRSRAARRRERPRGRLETIPGSQDIYVTRSARWKV
jgi:hypothetical protein